MCSCKKWYHIHCVDAKVDVKHVWRCQELMSTPHKFIQAIYASFSYTSSHVFCCYMLLSTNCSQEVGACLLRMNINT